MLAPEDVLPLLDDCEPPPDAALAPPAGDEELAPLLPDEEEEELPPRPLALVPLLPPAAMDVLLEQNAKNPPRWERAG